MIKRILQKLNYSILDVNRWILNTKWMRKYQNIYKHKNTETLFLDLKKVKIGSRIFFFFFGWVLETIKLFPKFLSWLYQGFKGILFSGCVYLDNQSPFHFISVRKQARERNPKIKKKFFFVGQILCVFHTSWYKTAWTMCL